MLLLTYIRPPIAKIGVRLGKVSNDSTFFDSMCGGKFQYSETVLFSGFKWITYLI